MATKHKPLKRWPLYFIAAPAAVAIWSGWVGLGGKTGFGPVHLFPGIAVFGLSHFVLNTAITLPIGVEAYAAYALGAWLRPGMPTKAKRFAKRSGIMSLIVGVLGQIAYHLMAAAHIMHSPWPITVLVSSLPVTVLGMAAALMHLAHDTEDAEAAEDEPVLPVSAPPVQAPAIDPMLLLSPQEAAQARRQAVANLVEERPELLEPGKGAELARVSGLNERTGQRLAKQLRNVRPVQWEPMAPENV